jgi:hypothetical protein
VCHVSGTVCHVSGTVCHVSGTVCQVTGTVCQVTDTVCQDTGQWHGVLCHWNSVSCQWHCMSVTLWVMSMTQSQIMSSIIYQLFLCNNWGIIILHKMIAFMNHNKARAEIVMLSEHKTLEITSFLHYHSPMIWSPPLPCKKCQKFWKKLVIRKSYVREW